MGLGDRWRNWRRHRAWRRAPTGPVRDYLAVPPPPVATECRAIRWVVVDLETTGLDAARDQILSIGLVEIHEMAIPLESAWHALVRPDRAIPEASAVIHGITDDKASAGVSLAEVLPHLLGRLSGAVMVAHHAALERAFLGAACRRLYGAAFMAPVADTETLARRTRVRRHQPIREGDLRLFRLREAHGLPRYPAHDALSDALATAELFLAMVAERSPDGRCRLGDILIGG